MSEDHDGLITIADEVECARRELSLRIRVYPRRVAAGHMTANQSRREIARMDAILRRLEAIEKAERLL